MQRLNRVPPGSPLRVRVLWPPLAVGMLALLSVATHLPHGLSPVAHMLVLDVLATAGLGCLAFAFARVALRRGGSGVTLADADLGDLVSDLPDAVFELDDRGVVSFLSEGSEWLLGISADEIVGRPLRDFVAEADRDALEEMFDAMRAGRIEESRGDVRFPHADGGTRVTNTAARAVRNAEGRLHAVRGVVRDISRRIAIEEALRASEARLRTVLETAQSGILIVMRDGRVSLYNRALCEMLGYSWDEMSRLCVTDLVPEEERATVASALSAPMWTGDGRMQREERLRRRDGSTIAVDLSVSSYREGGEVLGVLIEARDMTHRKEAEETIARLAYYDRLTGLPNRVLFDRLVAQAIAEAERSDTRVAVMLCDLDQFKIVNDTLGHHVGDRLLRDVAARFDGAVRRPHTLARLGGDEFMLLLPGLECDEQAAEVARDLLMSLEEPFVHYEQELHVDASIGISIAPADGDDADSLLRRADTAMYLAKAYRRNSYRFYAAATDHQPQRLALENGLRRALANAEFVVQYQPVLDARSGQVTSVEALVRWMHPERGIVAPDEFIPHLEETGMIGQLGGWVLREACRQMQAWREEGLDGLHVAVNLSGRQLEDDALVDTVADALAESGLPPQHLVVEVTETAAMDHVELAIEVLNRLRALGVATLLDDFGTGHSSLSQLKRLPVRGLKIDRSFVQDIERDDDDRAIVAGVTALGHALGLEIIAEGVETAEQAEYLRALGSDALQGFHFARPMAPEAAAAFVRASVHAAEAERREPAA